MAALKESGESTLQEISEKTGESSKKVFKSLRKLFQILTLWQFNRAHPAVQWGLLRGKFAAWPLARGTVPENS